MSRFNAAKPKRNTVTPVRTEQTSSTRTAQGGAGYVRDPQGEAFLLGTTNLVGQDAFHEAGTARDERFRALIHGLAADGSGRSWLSGFLPWLRLDAKMRTAPVVAAAEFAAARRGEPDEGSLLSDTIAGVLQRADEPGELLAYWENTYGGTPPKAVKRGIAKALPRLYTEYAVAKYDTPSKGYRFARVLDICHPTTKDIRRAVLTRRPDATDEAVQVSVERTRALFGYLHARMRGRDVPIPQELLQLTQRAELAKLAPDEFRAGLASGEIDGASLRLAGMDWRAAAALWNGRLDATFWEAMEPSMGYQALLMNLRNFDKAAVRDEVIDRVARRLSDPEQVRRSRILPLQILAAYRATRGSLNWGRPQSRALEHSLDNIPTFSGRTLFLVDTSTSMRDRLSKDSELLRWDAAVIFAVALARRSEQAQVVSFSSSARYFDEPNGPHTKEFPLRAGEALLASIDRWQRDGFFLGGGTATAAALRQQFAGHDRVIVITDEQAGQDPVEVSRSVPEATPMYVLNLAGYPAGSMPSGSRTRVTIGGFSDAAFDILAAVESRARGRWPWEGESVD